MTPSDQEILDAYAEVWDGYESDQIDYILKEMREVIAALTIEEASKVIEWWGCWYEGSDAENEAQRRSEIRDFLRRVGCSLPGDSAIDPCPMCDGSGDVTDVETEDARLLAALGEAAFALKPHFDKEDLEFTFWVEEDTNQADIMGKLCTVFLESARALALHREAKP